MTLKERWIRIQEQIGAVADGEPRGPNTVSCLEKALGIGAPGQAPEVVKGILKRKSEDSAIDARSAKNIATLHPRVQPIFKSIVLAGKRIAKELGAGDYQMIGGTRTYAEQNDLWAKGRTTPGPRVTNAKGGYSNHNFGIAGDFGAFSKEGTYLGESAPALEDKIHRAVAAWVKETYPGEIEWGGDWTSFKDYPHFQYDTGLSLAQMRERVAAGKSVL